MIFPNFPPPLDFEGDADFSTDKIFQIHAQSSFFSTTFPAG